MSNLQNILVQALEADRISKKPEEAKKPGVRTPEQIKAIIPFIKSLSVFKKNYPQLEDSDYEELAKVIELRKVEKNTRLFDIGDPTDDLMVILRG